MQRRTRALAAALGAGVLVAGATAAWRLHAASTPASPADALAGYRAAAAAGDTAIPLGVYTYRTTGSESTSALEGTVHRYPLRSAITVAKAPCGMTLRWDVLETRSTTITICITGERANRSTAGRSATSSPGGQRARAGAAAGHRGSSTRTPSGRVRHTSVPHGTRHRPARWTCSA